jgi:hypothetical protein
MSAKREHLCGSPPARKGERLKSGDMPPAPRAPSGLAVFPRVPPVATNIPLLRSSGFRAVFVLFGFVSWLKEKNLEPRKHTNGHEQKNKKLLGWGELFKLRVEPFALTHVRASATFVQPRNHTNGHETRSKNSASLCLREPSRYRSRF